MNNINHSDCLDYIQTSIEKSIQAKKDFWSTQAQDVVTVAQWMGEAFQRQKKILIFGNGGSAADAQHMAAEMVGRMLIERSKPLPAIALTTDTSNLTAIANDYSYDDVFDLQVRALGSQGDIAIALSTSGNSKNVLKAVESAKKIGMKVVSLTGKTGGQLKGMSDINFNVRLGEHSSMIQETHSTIIHLLVDLMDRFFLPQDYVKKP